jgi:GlcNAc-P-P-Und epimerase
MNNILFTGASGFLGNNIIPTLQKSGFLVSTLGLAECDYCCDLSEDVPMLSGKYNVVLHAAGKAHVVPKTKIEEKSFFDVNVRGTMNLCQGLEMSGLPQSFIFISTVAVYGRNMGEDITEEHPLEGQAPYALSKIEAEKYLVTWCKKHRIKLSILRPSLIAGPNPPGNLGAMIQGIKSGRYLRIAGGKAKKSVLMVQDLATLVPLLIDKEGTYNVCATDHPSFYDLEKVIAKQLGKSNFVNLPYVLAKVLALMGDIMGKKSPINSVKLEKISRSLTFSNEKARHELDWEPMSILDNFKII